VGNRGLGRFPHDSGSDSVPLRPHLGRWSVGGKGWLSGSRLNVTLW
jgi:hypothetical protein